MSNFDFYDEFTEFKRHILDELALVRQLLKPGETNLSTENLQLQLQLNNKTEVIDVLKNEIKHLRSENLMLINKIVSAALLKFIKT